VTTKQRKPLFERLRAGLEEGIAHARGELNLKTIEVPDPPPEIDSGTIVALRRAAEMSQAVFAGVLHVSPKTVQSWEQGTRIPSMVSRRLIHIFAEAPGTVCKVVGVPPVVLRGFRVVRQANGKLRIVQAAKNGHS
jgi:putative transcriptional regulator